MEKDFNRLVVLVVTLVSVYISYILNVQRNDLEAAKAFILSYLNVTERSAQNELFFNRVPKTGSSSMIAILSDLSVQNDFAAFSYQVSQDGLDVETQHMSHALTNCSSLSPSCSYYKHMYFINFETFGKRNPIYVNMVRHPIDRLESWFYYVRSTPYIMMDPDSMSIRRLKGSLEDCIQGRIQCDIAAARDKQEHVNELVTNNQSRIERIRSLSKIDISRILAYNISQEAKTMIQSDEVTSQISYFCGYAPECRRGSSRRLAKAKANVEKFYAVVGVLEHMDVSLKVFEKFVPRFFSGITDMPVWNTNRPRPRLSPESKRILHEWFRDEIDFYDFCVRRLFKQYNALLLL